MPRIDDERYWDMVQDANDAADSDARDAAINGCKESDPTFVWKWRIVESATMKIPALLRSTDPKEVKKGKSLQRRIKHLQKYCSDAIEEWLSEARDAAEEARDPYGYRGLRRSDF
jgi:hypothetical protein